VSEPLTARDAAAYRHWTPLSVRYADLDTLGHVSNSIYGFYIEEGRAFYLREIGLWIPDAAVQNVVARLEIDFIRELRYPATLRVGSRIVAVGRSSYQVGNAVFCGDVCHATGLSVLVRWDTQSRRSLPLDQAALATLHGQRHR